MAENMDIKKLTEYRCQINSTVVENVKESVTKLNEVMAMIADLQSINEALSLALTEADKEKESQAHEIETLRKSIQAVQETAQQFEKKKKQYDVMDLSLAKVANLLATLDEREKQLDILEKKLSEEKKQFEEERDNIIASKNDADEKANQYKKEKNDAIRSRDTAIAERDKAVKDKETVGNDRAEIEEKLAKKSKELEQTKKELVESTKLMEWYRGYAIAVDRKVVDFFRGKNKDLDSHYYTFLNDPDKLDEIHIHFSDYIIEEEIEDKADCEDKVKIQIESEEQKCEKNDLVKSDEEQIEKREKRNTRSDRPEFLD